MASFSGEGEFSPLLRVSRYSLVVIIMVLIVEAGTVCRKCAENVQKKRPKNVQFCAKMCRPWIFFDAIQSLSLI